MMLMITEAPIVSRPPARSQSMLRPGVWAAKLGPRFLLFLLEGSSSYVACTRYIGISTYIDICIYIFTYMHKIFR